MHRGVACGCPDCRVLLARSDGRVAGARGVLIEHDGAVSAAYHRDHRDAYCRAHCE